MFKKLDVLMFEDVGKKLKNIIKWIMHAEIILLVIAAVVMEIGAFIQLCNGAGENILIMLLIPIGLVLAIGVLWLSMIVLYGFAEIIDTAIVNRKEEENFSAKNPSVSSQPHKQTLSDYFNEYRGKEAVTKKSTSGAGPTEWTCTCGKVNPAYMSSCACGKTAREIREMKKG